MGEPIVNPMWFYYLQLVEKASFICFIATIVFGIIIVCGLVFHTVTYLDEYDISFTDEEITSLPTRIKSFIKVPMIFFIIALIIGAIIPTKETLVSMKIAEYATYENVDIATEKIKDITDYIFEKIDGLDDK